MAVEEVHSSQSPKNRNVMKREDSVHCFTSYLDTSAQGIDHWITQLLNARGSDNELFDLRSLPLEYRPSF